MPGGMRRPAPPRGPPSAFGSGATTPRGPMSPGGPPQQPRDNPFGPSLGYDPAKPAAAKETAITNTRVELPPIAYAHDQGVSTSVS